jgi:hypothetical protein
MEKDDVVFLRRQSRKVEIGNKVANGFDPFGRLCLPRDQD